ncbi:MAG: FliO/MopB family protein [Rickettsiales bacterium]
MDEIDFTRFAFAFLFVIGLIGAMGWMLKRFGNSQKVFGATDGSGRLNIIETRYLDPRRKLVLIRRDDTEHLLLLADGRETVIESNIEAKEAQKDA